MTIIDATVIEGFRQAIDQSRSRHIGMLAGSYYLDLTCMKFVIH
jgi:hypothetical protein